MAKTTCFLSSSVLVVVCSFSLNPRGKSFQRMTRCNPAPETAWPIQIRCVTCSDSATGLSIRP